MTMRSLETNPQSSQSGVTLLLAILVLSAITAISFSLAAIVFVEIRSSGDLQRTEPALYATQGVIEQSIFKVQRDVPDTQMCYDPSNVAALNPATGATATSCTNNTPIKSNISIVTISGVAASDLADSPISETVDPTSNTFTNTKNVYNIYDAQSPNNPQNGYTKVRVENRSIADLKYTFCEVETTSDCTPPSWTTCSSIPSQPVGLWNPFYGTISGNSYIERSLVRNKIYRLYVYQQCLQTTPAYIDVYSYGPQSAADTCTGGGGVGECIGKGLPLKGKKQVDVTAANAGLTRRYRVLVPLSK